MGGITSTHRAELTAENFCGDDDLIPKEAEGYHEAAKKVQGSHVFEISGYSRLQPERPGDCGRVTSAVFDVGGFGWQIVFLTRGMFANGEHVAAFLTLVSEDQQEDIRVRASFQLSLVDVTGSTPPHTMAGSNEFDPEEYRSGCSGCLAFKNIKELEAHYLHDDRITIECLITVEGVITADNKDANNSSADEVPPFDMNFEEPDVIFEVEGETFPAHKRVLAVHSPVFKAELYGAMRENGMDRITIGEMQPVVFETLLHFIYKGSLPAMDNDLGRREYNDAIWHLLVAADRYAVDKLKSRCEAILCGNIDVKNVLTTLDLADQHHCYMLNEACLQFLASLGRVHMDDLMAGREYAELKANRPLALVELWEKTCRLGRTKSSFHIGGSLP